MGGGGVDATEIITAFVLSEAERGVNYGHSTSLFSTIVSIAKYHCSGFNT